MSDRASQDLGELLAVQAGVVARRQALAAGLSQEAIRHRLHRGRWQPIYPGVYAAFTGAAGRPSVLWAAVLRAGPGAVLSHQTAAELDGIHSSRDQGRIHVTVPTARHIEPGHDLAVHRSGRIAAARHPARQPPRTRIEETLIDLTQTVPTFDQAFEWLCRGCGGRLTTPAHVLAAMSLRPQLRWRADLAAALGEVKLGVQSNLELRYVRGVERAHCLPRATRQVKASSNGRLIYRDILYKDYGVAVETDGEASHPEAARWRDIGRDNAAAASGLVTLRYSWADITSHPCMVAAEVAAVLAAHSWRGSARPCKAGCPVGTP